ncbi:hypothetical protein HDK77DRAFT_176752 [Phyllosticta capitalensis]|uniref:NAD(P)-binding protein n=1 Tax=Phyllosticta capitalensis TaxID=121624 RepID=A0ABR1YUQ0_9PEZI
MSETQSKPETKKDPKNDINNVPYEAPLNFDLPPIEWIGAKNYRGMNDNSTVSIEPVDLSGKWVVISGSNSGIGREAALKMASWGANIILACREPRPSEEHPDSVAERCIQAAREAGHEKSEVEFWQIDMADLETVDKFAQRWLDTGRPLDILCNNAGIGDNPGGHEMIRTKDGLEIFHQINFLSHVLLTLRLLPAIAKAHAPRIICTTSCFHYLGVFNLEDCNGDIGMCGPSGILYYRNNKLFMQIWQAELQRRLLQHPQYRHITVQGVHPGYVYSGLWNMNYASFMRPIKELLLKYYAWWYGISAQQGGLAIVNAATCPEAGPDPKVQGVGVEGGRGGGRYWHRIWEDEPMPHVLDPDCRCRLWRKVNDELKLKEKGLLDVLGVEM